MKLSNETKLVGAVVSGALLALIIGSYNIAPWMITFSYHLLVAITPWLTAAVVLFVLTALVSLKSSTAGGIFQIVAIVTFFVGGWWYESNGNYNFAQDYINVEQISQMPETVPESFRDITSGIANQIISTNTEFSQYKYSKLVPSYTGGIDGYITQKVPKKFKQRTQDTSFEVFKINSSDLVDDKNIPSLEQVFVSNYAVSGGWYDTDLQYVLQKKRIFSNILMSDSRYVLNPRTKNWALVVPVEDIRVHNGLYRTWTWSGNFFIENNQITFLSKRDIETSDYKDLHVVPQKWVQQVSNQYRFAGADSWWGIQFGSDLDFSTSEAKADHILTTEWDATPVFVEYEGISSKTESILYLTGSGIKSFKTDDQYSPDIFAPKVDAILSTNNNLIVKRTNYPTTSIATWEKSEYLPVVRENDVWFVYFIYSSSDETARRGLVAVNSNNRSVSEGQEINTDDTDQFMYFRGVNELEGWLSGNEIENYLPQPAKQVAPQIKPNRIGSDREALNKILKNQEEILKRLRQLEESQL